MNLDEYIALIPHDLREGFTALLAKREREAGWHGFERGYDHGWHDGQQGNERIS